MKLLSLTQGKVAIVDDEDFDFLNQWKWYNANGYAARKKYERVGIGLYAYKTLFLHSLLCPSDGVTDHVNGNSLDNRKINLRACTQKQNVWNTPKKVTNTSGYKGVSYHKPSGKWVAQIYEVGRKRYLGIFKDIGEAKAAYDKAARRLHGEYARL